MERKLNLVTEDRLLRHTACPGRCLVTSQRNVLFPFSKQRSLKTEAARSFGTSVNTRQTGRCHVPEDGPLHSYCSQNIRSHITEINDSSSITTRHRYICDLISVISTISIWNIYRSREYLKKQNKKFSGLSPQANYTDRATPACRRGCRLVSATDPHGRILGFLDRSRYYFLQVAPQLYSRGWVDPVPDPLLLRKSGNAGNQNRTSGSVAKQENNFWLSTTVDISAVDED
jgi:hypothetical protein